MNSPVAVTTPGRTGRVRLSSRFWVLATVLTSLLVGMLRLLWERRYFFHQRAGAGPPAGLLPPGVSN